MAKAIKECDKILTVTIKISNALKQDHMLKETPIYLHNIPITRPLHDNPYYFHELFNISKQN